MASIGDRDLQFGSNAGPKTSTPASSSSKSSWEADNEDTQLPGEDIMDQLAEGFRRANDAMDLVDEIEEKPVGLAT